VPRLPADVVFAQADPASDEARGLIAALDADIGRRYPGQPVHPIDPSALVRNGGLFLVGRLDGRGVACGALRPLSTDAVEVKRMYVAPFARRMGIGGQLLRTLERLALERGCAVVRIETGFKQPEAIAFYEKTGYARIPCFGEYAANSYSVCFEKRLVAGAAASSLRRPRDTA
jgi:putative acetyltransferase